MTTLAQCRRLLKLTGWQIKTKTNPSIKPRSHVVYDYVHQTATVEFREKFDEETRTYLLWHELSHLVLIDISEFLKKLLTKEEFAYYEKLEERAVNQFANALNDYQGSRQ